LDTDQPELYNKLESIFVEINGLLVPFFIEKSSWSKLDALNIAFKNSSEAMVDQSLGKSVYLPLLPFQNLQETILLPRNHRI
jgi:16S rRNA processing protein RimM